MGISGKTLVEGADGGYKVSIHHTDDNIDLVRTLLNQTYIDAMIPKCREYFPGYALCRLHAAAYDRNEADPIAHFDTKMPKL